MNTALLQRYFSQLDPVQFGDAYVNLFGMNKLDAATFIQQNSCGILLQSMPKQITSNLKDQLETLGEELIMIPAEGLEPLPRAMVIRRAEYTATEMVFFDMYDRPTSISWDSFSCICTAASNTELPAETTANRSGKSKLLGGITTGFLVGGPIGAAVGGGIAAYRSKLKNSSSVTEDERKTVVDEFIEFWVASKRLRFKINPREFSYSCLGTDMKEGYHANFRTLAKVLRDNGREAGTCDDSLNRLVEDGSINTWPSRQLWERYINWLVVKDTPSIV